MPKIEFYGSDGKPLTHFTQWDNNREITIKGLKQFTEPPDVHYWDKDRFRALVVPSTIEGKDIKVKVPNILMTTADDVIFSVYDRTAGNEGTSLLLHNIPVWPKTMPEDYDLTDNIDYISFKKLIEEAEALLLELNNAGNQIVITSEEALKKAQEAAAAAEEAKRLTEQYADQLAEIPGMRDDIRLLKENAAGVTLSDTLEDVSRKHALYGTILLDLELDGNGVLINAYVAADPAENWFEFSQATETGTTIYHIDASGWSNRPGEGNTQNIFATCNDPAAPAVETANNWYVPKTMPRPSGEVGMAADVLWRNGRSDGLGYNVSLVWGEPGGADNETILSGISVTDNLTMEHSIPAEGTIRYQLEESSGRKRWRYVSGSLIHKGFSTNAEADAPDKAVPGLTLSYLPGTEIYVQMDKGNAAEQMRLVPDEGPTLPVYGNGIGKATGEIPAGYILHLVNGGDHWQIINGPSEGGGTQPPLFVTIEVTSELDPATPAAATIDTSREEIAAALEAGRVIYYELWTISPGIEDCFLGLQSEDETRVVLEGSSSIKKPGHENGTIYSIQVVVPFDTWSPTVSLVEAPTIADKVPTDQLLPGDVYSAQKTLELIDSGGSESMPPMPFNLTDLGFNAARFTSGEWQSVSITPEIQTVLDSITAAMSSGQFAIMTVETDRYLLSGYAATTDGTYVTGSSGDKIISMKIDTRGNVSIQMRGIVLTVVITPNGPGEYVADHTASQIVDADRTGVVKAEFTDPATNELRTYYYAKQTADTRAVFSKDGYIEDGIPKQTLIYVGNTGRVSVETRSSGAEQWATTKSDGHPEWSTLDQLYTYFYDLRESPTRREQIESTIAKNTNLMEILGAANGIDDSDRLFWYFSWPYSEAGGFCLDIEIVGRDRPIFFSRRISSTSNGNRYDTGWYDTGKSHQFVKVTGSTAAPTTYVPFASVQEFIMKRKIVKMIFNDEVYDHVSGLLDSLVFHNVQNKDGTSTEKVLTYTASGLTYSTKMVYGPVPDLSLGVTGAQVGQIVEVQEIDPDGKPTKWRAVDKPKAVYPVSEESASTLELTPNVYHKWPEMASITITLGAETPGVVNEFCGEFISGASPTTFSVPSSVKWVQPLKIEASKKYQFSIINGIGVIGGA